MVAFFLLLGLILGFCLGFCISLPDVTLVVVAIVLALFSLRLSYSKKQVPLFLLALAIGFFLGWFHLPIAEGRREVTGMVVKTGENYYILFAEFRRYYVYEKGHSREVGDILTVYGNVKNYVTANYESRFDFARYLKEIGVYGEVSSSSIKEVFANPIRLRAYENWFVGALNDDAKGLVYSALFGRRDYQNELIAKADELGLVFAVSSSGILYSRLLHMVEKRLKWKFDDRKAEWIVFFVSLVFLPFGFSKIGIRRVFLSKTFVLINRYFLNERFDRMEITCLSGIAIIALNRYEALSVGLWIGVGTSLAFRLSNRFIYKKFSVFTRFLARYVLLRLFLFPLVLAYNEGEVPILSGIYTQILLPLTFLIQLLGYLLMVLPFARPFLNPLGSGYMLLLKTLSRMNPTINFPPPTPFFYLAYYLVLIFVCFLVEAGFRKTPLLLSLSFVAAYLVTLTPIPIWTTDQVSFINVGQGDSILIRDNNTVVLLDTGGNTYFDMATEVLIPYFRKQRIDHIDCLIASHGDFDHIGAKEGLMENFEVRRFVDSPNDFPLRVGKMEFINYNYIEESNDENDKSLVLSLSFMEKKWIFTGDAPTFVEKNIIKENPDLDCDILKVGHHGSDTSTCGEWLDAITPDTAIISCGIKNSYGHPTQKVLDALTSRNIKIRRTDEEGTITYRSFSLIGL